MCLWPTVNLRESRFDDLCGLRQDSFFYDTYAYLISFPLNVHLKPINVQCYKVNEHCMWICFAYHSVKHGAWCAWLLRRASMWPILALHTYLVGRESSVGTATGYGVNPVEARFSAPIHIDPASHPVSLLGVKRPGRGVNHPPPSRAEVKERVELYLSSPSGPSWPVVGWPLPLPLLC